MTEVFRLAGIVEASMVGFLFTVQVSLFVLSWEINPDKLPAELFRRRDSRYPPTGFTVGLGLCCFMFARLLTVAEMGIRGGGMLSCCCWAEAFSKTSVGTVMLLLEFVRFHPKLSFRLSEVIEEGV